MNFLIKILLSSIAVLATGYLLPGVSVASFTSALILALVLSLLNVTLKPLLIIFTIPVTILTLGLFLLVINAVVILVADYFVTGVNVSGFIWALLFSIVLSVINAILNGIFTNG
ncbi:MAG: phage holin family protein [Cytophagales bacterium]|nr:phage holin family protein [Cytophagales bacterium]